MSSCPRSQLEFGCFQMEAFLDLCFHINARVERITRAVAKRGREQQQQGERKDTAAAPKERPLERKKKSEEPGQWHERCRVGEREREQQGESRRERKERNGFCYAEDSFSIFELALNPTRICLEGFGIG